jgi:hypothetical protein
MLFLQISKHSPESCPLNNEKSMKLSKALLMAKLEQLTKKHGVKMVGAWHDAGNHRIIFVWDGSMDALMKLWMEPEMIAWGALHTTELAPVTTLEETAKMFLK